MAYLDPNEAVPCHAESAARERFDRKREAPAFRSPATERAIGADSPSDLVRAHPVRL